VTGRSLVKDYNLYIPDELKHRHVHPRFHVSLLWPHHANDDALFPNRRYPDPYDFSALDNTEWFVEEITGHRWKARNVVEFKVKWSLGDTTWEPLASCNELVAMDAYLALMGARDWQDLPRCAGGTARRQR
jgi:hypothetical protein